MRKPKTHRIGLKKPKLQAVPAPGNCECGHLWHRHTNYGCGYKDGHNEYCSCMLTGDPKASPAMAPQDVLDLLSKETASELDLLRLKLRVANQRVKTLVRIARRLRDERDHVV